MHTRAVGLCGSHLHWFDEGSIGDAQLIKPSVLVHEVGQVVICGTLDLIRGFRVRVPGGTQAIKALTWGNSYEAMIHMPTHS